MKVFFKDSFKTILGSLLVAMVLQLIAFPLLVNQLGNDDFGKILTIFTLITVFSVVTGNSLNNIRLINATKLKSDVIYKQFILLIISTICLEILVLLPILLMYHLSYTQILILLFTFTLMFLRAYLLVIYRIRLDYNSFLKVSLLQVAGVLFGIIMFFWLKEWSLIFLFSEIFPSFYFVYSINKYMSERSAVNIQGLTKDYIKLSFINLMNNLINYSDRLILLPILGGSKVTYAFLATFIGKMVATFIYPVNNVILSYISVKENLNRRKQYVYTVIIMSIISFGILLAAYPVTIFIVTFIYRQEAEAFKNLILIGNLSILLGILSTMIQTINIKYIDMNSHFNIQGLFFIIYFLTIIFSTYYFDLYGFFIAAAINNLLKLISLLYIGLKDIKE